MTATAYLVGIAGAVLMLSVVIELLRRRRLRERHAVWWLIATTLAVIAGLFPGLLVWVADLVGVVLPANLVFFVSIGMLVLVAIQHSAELTDLESETRVLAERTALLEERIRLLEAGQRAQLSEADEGSDPAI
ncbi:DUF2304 domain-containing protein [Microbacterium atlanticum]|uniref:DUF2304 domain-containing protein n=1 Tax=Microbacterium atlanticum TaxID=2782168 RepID=UPI001888020F|nr:DUF2304 domain-containing protein [Microbacterium atlanticum]